MKITLMILILHDIYDISDSNNYYLIGIESGEDVSVVDLN